MPLDIQGMLLDPAVQNQIRNQIFAYEINYMIEQTPIFSRLNHQPAGSSSFTLDNWAYRPYTYTLGAAITTNSQLTLTLTDVSPLMQGDLLSFGNDSETVMVVSDPNTSANTVTIVRAYGSTTAVSSLANGSTIRLRGNARTGGEINQTGYATVATPVTQQCQTIQHPIQVGGRLMHISEFIAMPGTANALQQQVKISTQNAFLDAEASLVYGLLQVPSSSFPRGAMSGIRQLIAANAPQNFNASNYQGAGVAAAAPLNSSAFSAKDIISNLLKPAVDGGGKVDTIFVSTDWMVGLAQMGQGFQRVEAGSTVLGTPIMEYDAPFLNGARIVLAPKLDPGTAIGLVMEEISWGALRDFMMQPRGIQGDAIQLDIIMDGAVKLGNLPHHTFVEGVTGFAAA
jgi:hypothetical protein